jgi:hypothetical protein
MPMKSLKEEDFSSRNFSRRHVVNPDETKAFHHEEHEGHEGEGQNAKT